MQVNFLKKLTNYCSLSLLHNLPKYTIIRQQNNIILLFLSKRKKMVVIFHSILIVDDGNTV